MATCRLTLRNPYVTKEREAIPDWKYETLVTTTVLQLKREIEMKYPGNPKAIDQRLVFRGRMLSNDSDTLGNILVDEDLEEWHMLHLIPNRSGFSPSVSPEQARALPPLRPLANTPPLEEDEEKELSLPAAETSTPVSTPLPAARNRNPPVAAPAQTQQPTTTAAAGQGQWNAYQAAYMAAWQQQGQPGGYAQAHGMVSPQQQYAQYYAQQQQAMMAAWQQQAMAGTTSPQAMAIHQAAHQRATQQYMEYMQQYQSYQQQMAAYNAAMYGSPSSPVPLQGFPAQPAQELRRRRPAAGGIRNGQNDNVRAEPPEPERLPRRGNVPRNNVQPANVAENNGPNRQSLMGSLQIKFLIKIALVVYIVFMLDTTFSIKPHFNGKTRKLICIVATVYYFQNVGFLEYVRALMCGGGNRRRQQNDGGQNAGGDQANGDGQDSVPVPPRGNIPPATSPGLFIDLRCFIVSFLFSLHPSWYPVSMPSLSASVGAEVQDDGAQGAGGEVQPGVERDVQPAVEGEAEPVGEVGE
eukprot:g948.t1